LALGYIVPSGSALPISNLFYLLLSYAGGLWLPPNALPDSVQRLSKYLPTREYGELAWSIVLNQEFETRYLHGLILYTIFFAFLSFVAYRMARKS
jgi:ABC-2 type transport system permease protein